MYSKNSSKKKVQAYNIEDKNINKVRKIEKVLKIHSFCS